MSKRKAVEAPSGEAVIDPIPRHLPLQSVTLNFTQRTWETFKPGQLYYLPICQTPRYMFDHSMYNQFSKFREMFGTMEIHQPRVRMSNFIFLQDELRVQAGTPTDSTAYTQVMYMVDFQPKGQNMFFRLGEADNNLATASTNYSYQLEPPANTQFITINGFTNFDRMVLLPAQVNDAAGFEPGADIEIGNVGDIRTSYIPPNAESQLRIFSHSMEVNSPRLFRGINTSVGFARNMDKVSFHQHGDSIEFAPNTNLNKIKLMNTNANSFLHDQTLQVEQEIEGMDGMQTTVYLGEFVYPGRNRPFMSRADNLNEETNAITSGKHFKPLDHKFFCIAPIRKPNGQLLGQRCSFVLEQNISVTFHMNQSMFGEFDEDINFIAQDDGVIVRRGVYRKPVSIKKDNPYLCGDRNKKNSEKPPLKKRFKKDTKMHDNQEDQFKIDAIEVLSQYFSGFTDTFVTFMSTMGEDKKGSLEYEWNAGQEMDLEFWRKFLNNYLDDPQDVTRSCLYITNWKTKPIEMSGGTIRLFRRDFVIDQYFPFIPIYEDQFIGPRFCLDMKQYMQVVVCSWMPGKNLSDEKKHPFRAAGNWVRNCNVFYA